MSTAPVTGPPEPHRPAQPPRRRVLVVDDDPTVAEVVAGYLDRAGFAVERAADGPSAVARAAALRPDLVVLDLMLPGMDGLEVCRRMRERGPLPVVMLTARGDEDDRILGLEVGADDYVTKPFSPRELVLRVESVLRRAGSPPAPGPWLRSGPLALDPAARRALRDGHELPLTIREFDLLAFFLRHPGRVVGREELMRRVWGWEFGDLSTVTVHVRRLREKVEQDPARPRLITTVWGVGYRFDPPPPAPGTSPPTGGSGGGAADGAGSGRDAAGIGGAADPDRVPDDAGGRRDDAGVGGTPNADHVPDSGDSGGTTAVGGTPIPDRAPGTDDSRDDARGGGTPNADHAPDPGDSGATTAVGATPNADRMPGSGDSRNASALCGTPASDRAADTGGSHDATGLGSTATSNRAPDPDRSRGTTALGGVADADAVLREPVRVNSAADAGDAARCEADPRAAGEGEGRHA